MGRIAVQDEVGAFLAVGDDDELFLGGDIGHGQAGLALDHGEFVVVANNAPGGVDSLTEIVRREDDDLKCRVEDHITGASAELPGVQAHDLGIGRADDPEAAALAEVGQIDRGCLASRAGIERGDLVAFEVRHHEGGRGQCAVVLDNIVHADAELIEGRAIGSEVVADRAHQMAGFAEEGQGIADVSGDAAALFSEGVDQEADRDDVGFLRDDVVSERAAESHDVVIRDRSADDRVALRRQDRLPVSDDPVGTE
jgi:hypothetical protein